MRVRSVSVFCRLRAPCQTEVSALDLANAPICLMPFAGDGSCKACWAFWGFVLVYQHWHSTAASLTSLAWNRFWSSVSIFFPKLSPTRDSVVRADRTLMVSPPPRALAARYSNFQHISTILPTLSPAEYSAVCAAITAFPLSPILWKNSQNRGIKDSFGTSPYDQLINTKEETGCYVHVQHIPNSCLHIWYDIL